MTCSLCAANLDDVDVSGIKGHLLTEQCDMQTIAFLKGSAISGDAKMTALVCSACFEKIQIVSGIQKKFCPREKNEVGDSKDVAGQGVEDAADEDDDDQRDYDYDELNQLSTFYAEQDDLDNDPEYEPDSKKAKSKKTTATTSTAGGGGARQRRKSRNESSLTCQLCPASLRRVATLRRHYISQHHYDPALANVKAEQVDSQEEKNGERLNCKECPDSYPNVHVLIKHVLHSHVGTAQSDFKCKRCEKSFRYERDLKTHQERLCKPAVAQYQNCKFCHKSYISSHIKTHQSYVHECFFCAHISVTRTEKTRHLSEHHAVEMLPNKCLECEGRFETNKCLLKHQRMVHAKNFVKCPRVDCKQVFAKGSVGLKRHLQKYHHPDNEALRATYRYECRECSKKVKSEALLRCHMAVKHNAGGPKAKCPFCDYTVPMKRRNDIYRYHIRRAHPEREEDIAREKERLLLKKKDHLLRAKVQCFLCVYAATKASNMTRHYTEVHDYDKNLADKMNPDPDNPDGALCPECGEHFANRHVQIKHLIKVHSRSGGEQCLYCNYRYLNVEDHISTTHQKEKSADAQFCRKCTPEQIFSSFEDLLRHTRSYHRKKPESHTLHQRRLPVTAAAASKASALRESGKSRLCENCGRTTASQFMARHRSECPKTIVVADDDKQCASTSASRRYVPVHLSGICPYCEKKFSDLLGHLRIGHEKEKKSPDHGTTCMLCNEKFSSVRELVSHRQLHPNFKSHACLRCKAEFDTVVELRHHRLEVCSKRKKKKKAVTASVATGGSATGGLPEATAGSVVATPQATVINSPNAKSEAAGGVFFKPKQVDYEGRGTVSCHMCSRHFTMKVLLRRHYQSHHEYKPDLAMAKGLSEEEIACNACSEKCHNRHAWIKHQLSYHTVISGQVCPYCDCKWGTKKFDCLDEHVNKHHFWDTQSPVQQCSNCKVQFGTYEELKEHRQIHDKQTVELSDTNHGVKGLIVHSRVGAIADISNRGGVRCLLCNVFKLRKDHLKTHYVKHHGYDPKLAAAEDINNAAEPMQDEETLDEGLTCPSCHEVFHSNHLLIKHLLKHHCNYTGLICPYCKGHHPERYLDLQSHVTQKHIDQLTGYNVDNSCKVCKENFSGYAELRDHVQHHGNAYRDPYGNPEAYKEYARNRKRINGKIVPFHKLSECQQKLDDSALGGPDSSVLEVPTDDDDDLFKEIFADDNAETAKVLAPGDQMSVAVVESHPLTLEVPTGSLLLDEEEKASREEEEEEELFKDIIAATSP